MGKGLQDTAAPTRAVSQAQVNGLVSEVLPQGCWRDDDYLWLTDRSPRLVEFTDGYLELLPMPSRGHQRVLAFLFMAFRQFLAPAGGEALFAPLRLRIREGKFREPDLLAVRDAQDLRSGNRFWTGADVVVEVVSPDGEERDLIDKRSDYAEAAIPEYWIVDPRTETISVLKLDADGYVEHGAYGRGDSATSSTLAGFGVDVAQVFDAAGE